MTGPQRWTACAGLFPLHLKSVEALVFRVPIPDPVATSFGVMRDRPAVVVRVEDGEGGTGWGEVFCNWPTVGAEHRGRLVNEVLAPMVAGQVFDHPQDVALHLERASRVLVIQCDEPGPFAQCMAGIDVAVWDLAARRAGVPLWQLLSGTQAEGPVRLPVYASGLNPGHPVELAQQKWAEGYRAFKLKVGFGLECDLANLSALRVTLGEDVPLMIDANQAWTPEEALVASALLAPYAPTWLEEPLQADVPLAEWAELSQQSPIALAAGENMRSDAAFDAAIASGAFRYLQPDCIKWGGVSRCYAIGQRIVAGGVQYCPHYFGGGIGLLASAHLLAAVERGGARGSAAGGVLEVDVNWNPLRTWLAHPFPPIEDGRMVLPSAPGLGVEPDLAALAPYRVAI